MDEGKGRAANVALVLEWGYRTGVWNFGLVVVLMPEPGHLRPWLRAGAAGVGPFFGLWFSVPGGFMRGESSK